ncbi:glutamine-hydrolyzing GMP synthase [Candidatus Curtissbacteria bacterium RIFCSPLOWO2_01_FULL_42_26]|uniref:GMP synthase [glutamine-hydrolyzing] n=1 Tax=Candidatus Curtissbacteria bacterium RIFCSPLOWO2_01_FULL_42_26 TaxID=1797729 RepID=A0A1F5HYF4_9BACT|nr:MAG: glutamine-hydrolyzing GMP synthase [Candidatus Curtissbacteria bacterium RIFCSPLOWO2_01_FULL_42_26]
MVLVFNFGGQYAHLIARKVRELGVKSELVAPDISVSQVKKLNPQAIIFSGSPYSVYDKNAPHPDTEIYDLGIPILGICYGHQLLAYQLKGRVSPGKSKQFGKEKLFVSKSPLFTGLSKEEQVWFSHGDHVNSLPPDFRMIASTSSSKIAAMENLDKKYFSVQFHPEVTHTKHGMKVLSNFLFDIVGAKRDWNLKSVKENVVKKLKKDLTGQKVLMALSGGVDSLVAATLIREAIANNLHLVFIDTGLLRTYDLKDLDSVVKKAGFKNLKIVNAQSKFLKVLEGVLDPEEKRQKIAKVYFLILEEEAKKIGSIKYLAQGTIYPDRIESAQTSKHADKIKSHHNVTLPHGLKLKMVEPLADFYKDEVRKIGKLSGIPQEFLNRHPFPGPGLAIRVLGEVTEDGLEILRQVDEIFISELKLNNMYMEVNQALAVLLPVKAVGVMGDSRTYSYIVSLRSVDTDDFMTADWSKIPYEILEKVSSRIVNEVRGVNRVVYDITQKPPATIEYE